MREKDKKNSEKNRRKREKNREEKREREVRVVKCEDRGERNEKTW